MIANFNFDAGKSTTLGAGFMVSAEISRSWVKDVQRNRQAKAQLSVEISQKISTSQIPPSVALKAYQDLGFSQKESKKMVEDSLKLTQKKTKDKPPFGSFSLSHLSESNSGNLIWREVNPEIRYAKLQIFSISKTENIIEFESVPYSVVKNSISLLGWSNEFNEYLLAGIRRSQTYTQVAPSISPNFYVYESLEFISSWGIYFLICASIIGSVILLYKKYGQASIQKWLK